MSGSTTVRPSGDFPNRSRRRLATVGPPLAVQRGGATRRNDPDLSTLETQRMPSRRRFFQIVPVAGASLLAAGAASAQANMLSEKDPQAIALAYVADAAKVDKAKQSKYAAGQTCSTARSIRAKLPTRWPDARSSVPSRWLARASARRGRRRDEAKGSAASPPAL